ncbi:MAG: hypothetical protein BA873_03005 [Desulfobulbaceae bacterium C00003063]|nr:MAG: hypothetical protein BA873_03005 [Desulfobulbaceae bacterium C00003063]
MRKYTGWVILSTLVFYLLSVLVPFLLTVPTLLAWLVPLLMWRVLGKNACNQALLLLLTGFLAIIFSATQGVFLGFVFGDRLQKNGTLSRVQMIITRDLNLINIMT